MSICLIIIYITKNINLVNIFDVTRLSKDEYQVRGVHVIHKCSKFDTDV